MNKYFKYVLFYICILFLIAFSLFFIHKFGVFSSYGNWWLSKIGALTGIDSFTGRILISNLLDTVIPITILIIIICFIK